MRSFRVYNRVRKVGVTFPVAGVDVGMASMLILFAVGAVAATLALLAYLAGGAPALIAVGVVGVVAFLVTLVFVARLTNMSTLTELTQFRLIADSVRSRRYTNFSTPDTPGDISYGHELFPDAASVYRNF